jgi:hypothetical protein
MPVLVLEGLFGTALNAVRPAGARDCSQLCFSCELSAGAAAGLGCETYDIGARVRVRES